MSIEDCFKGSSGILKVVEETQVRGTVERTYALAFNLNRDFEAILTENSGRSAEIIK